MQTFLVICLGVGAGYAVISFVLGQVVSGLDIDMDMDLDGGLLPFKPSVIAAFLTVFGGAGLILMRRMNILTAITLAGVMGVVLAYLIYRYVIRPLSRAQNTSAVEKQSLIGHLATVTEKIPQGGYGKITYYVNGNTYSSPAKSDSGEEIPRNESVDITSIVKNTYFVKTRVISDGRLDK